MRLRDQVALTLPSLFLRLILGITFLWAGTGKLVGTYTVSGDDAARLANIGIMPTAPSPQSTPNPISEPVIEDPEDLTPTLPETDDSIAPPAEAIIEKTDDAPEIGEDLIEKSTEQLPGVTNEEDNENEIRLQTVQYSGASYAASDFPDPMEVKRVYSIALMLSRAADPGLTADSSPIEPIMPEMFGSGLWPKVLAWAAAITELAAGVFLIIGLFTRISSLCILSVMLTAIWMTQLGPATIQSNNAILGFIPNHADLWSPGSYSTLLWQLALAGMSLAVFFLGSGAIGVDRMIFKPAPRDPYIHGDPKASKGTKNAKAAQATPPVNRGEFDRTPNPTP